MNREELINKLMESCPDAIINRDAVISWTKYVIDLVDGHLKHDWISVNDRLPSGKSDENDEYEIYLCWCKDKSYRMCYYCEGAWWDEDEDYDDPEGEWYEVNDVTHWMEVPKGPKEISVVFKDPWNNNNLI